jgi:hypothetical protein
MAGLVPAIHGLFFFFVAANPRSAKEVVDGRHKAGHDDIESGSAGATDPDVPVAALIKEVPPPFTGEGDRTNSGLPELVNEELNSATAEFRGRWRGRVTAARVNPARPPLPASPIVMAGLVPAIHGLFSSFLVGNERLPNKQVVDGRHKAGHDDIDARSADARELAPAATPTTVIPAKAGIHC